MFLHYYFSNNLLLWNLLSWDSLFFNHVLPELWQDMRRGSLSRYWHILKRRGHRVCKNYLILLNRLFRAGKCCISLFDEKLRYLLFAQGDILDFCCDCLILCIRQFIPLPIFGHELLHRKTGRRVLLRLWQEHSSGYF